MRSKAPLVMIEQMIMLLVFALAAVLCLQAFTTSKEISEESICRDRAVVEVQNAAESMKAGDGETYFREMGANLGEEGGQIFYNEKWKPFEDSKGEMEAAFRLQLSYKDTDIAYLQSAEIAVYDAEGELLFSMPVSWQNREVE
ncbi:hypothetical protein AALA22_01860 [Anaerovoracaceae bacterium 41-7]|jgi:hypothetical protein|uniref:Uncharacterized protein n=1 Tax=Anaerotruncus colihominis TaxID=169435 RepID=A0A845QKG9_9FIRM|nr:MULTISPECIES: hypothetical protein [Clostridia]MCI9475041.1 hypothetical protein [Emergencia sp.]MCI9639824.1 hypothetical protein [Emergencia sp.]NBH61253.1 hypothetical protein [Anaerotruncus colihominis]NCE97791.1 hypothetical protein [Emergencia sp. 1XD21-10]NCF01908.1 hypothetical protein [Anaerotruncus sp. 80]